MAMPSIMHLNNMHHNLYNLAISITALCTTKPQPNLRPNSINPLTSIMAGVTTTPHIVESYHAVAPKQ